jgi:2-oxoglutarate ferredoxin oxidoreductase subunit gamma
MAMTHAVPLDLRHTERSEVRFGGFGGQGIILSGAILGRAAIVHAGRNAVMSQSYGPESRGGACMAEVVIADDEITYPRVLTPNLIVMMSQEAYRKYSIGRPADSLLIVDEDLVTVDEDVEQDLKMLKAPATRIAEEMGRRIIANVVMLGFVTGATNIVSIDIMREAVASSVPPGTEELHLRAVDTGYEHALNLLSSMEGDGRV